VLPAMPSGTAGAAFAHAGAASRHGSTTSPPLARRQPTLTRVALTCIYTARTTHSRHRLPLAARFHSTARAPAHTFLVPARSPRKTRPSRRPPRSARPLVRPTSFMRTTTPRPPPAKALRNSRFNLRFSSRCDIRPKSRPLRPAATQDQHDSPATLNSARTPPPERTHHNGRAAGH
jgi:hypothetical protein